jgi:hypothetical protein
MVRISTAQTVEGNLKCGLPVYIYRFPRLGFDHEGSFFFADRLLYRPRMIERNELQSA